MWKAVVAAVVLGLVPAPVRMQLEPSVPVMLFPSYLGQEEFCSYVLICSGDLLAEQGFAQTAILFSCGEKGWLDQAS